MQENEIQEIALDVKKILAKESSTRLKINEIESKLNKMNNYFPDTDLHYFAGSEEKLALDDFIRKGIESEFITKSFSGRVEDGGGTNYSNSKQKNYFGNYC